MKENKEYDVPERLALFMDKMVASEKLRDICIKFPFGFRRAKRCAAHAEYFKRKFWVGFFDIYPELKDKKISYSLIRQKAVILSSDIEKEPDE